MDSPHKIRIFALLTFLGSVATAQATSDLPLALSSDTIVENEVTARQSPIESFVYLINRTQQPLHVNSIEVGLDRNVFKTFSMNFMIFSFAEVMRGFDKVFYWSEDGTSSWMSAPLLIPARDSIRIFQLQFDRCVSCMGRLGYRNSREIVVPLIFKAGKTSVTLNVKGWYLMPGMPADPSLKR